MIPQQQPTPFDIIDPSGPAVVVSQELWIALLVVFALLWLAIWWFVRQQRETYTSLEVSPVIEELKSALQEFEKTREKAPLHLFIKTLQRHPELISEEVNEHLSTLEAERFAPSLSEAAYQSARELLSILAHARHEEQNTFQREAVGGG